MKTIYVFSFLVSIFFAVFTPSALFSQSAQPPRSSKYGFSMATQAGFLYGQGEEIVYKHSGSDDYLSLLSWDVKPLFYAGFILRYSPVNPLKNHGFFTELSVKFGIPAESGRMENRDWVDSGYLTHFSSHENHTKGAVLPDFSAGFSFPVANRLVFSVYKTFSYMYFSWTSYNGYLEYADSDWERHYFHGPAISYLQHWMILSAGIGVAYPFHTLFAARLDFRFSPLVFCIAQDQHFSRSLEFNDYPRGGIFLEPKLALTFSPLSKLDLVLSAGYRYISGARGDTHTRKTGIADSNISSKSFNSAGAGFGALSIGLAVTMRL